MGSEFSSLHKYIPKTFDLDSVCVICGERSAHAVHLQMESLMQDGAKLMELQNRILKMMNQLLGADRKAIQDLIEYRRPVNDEIEKLDDNDVILLEDETGKLFLGVLGILNGILGPENKIVGVYSDAGELEEFQAKDASNI
jgi:hypothetical protein